MTEQLRGQLIRLRPRDDTMNVSRGRTVLATDRDGFVNDGTERGLFVYETRLLSRYRRADGASDYEVLDTRGTLHVVRQPSPWSLTASLGERLRDVLASLLPGR